MQDQVTLALGIAAQRVKGHFMETDTQFRVFLTTTEEVMINIETGKGLFKRVSTRPVLYQLNALHLNSIKGAWTWIADGFAVLLVLLALTRYLHDEGETWNRGPRQAVLGSGLRCASGIHLVHRCRSLIPDNWCNWCNPRRCNWCNPRNGELLEEMLLRASIDILKCGIAVGKTQTLSSLAAFTTSRCSGVAVL
ncbi:MAG: hypothetical protein JKY56_13250 [Kofleriaceae bacterium]|nr:hypothetical protein [Kofleriaceae bacterium]